MNGIKSKIKNETIILRNEVKEKTVGYILTALGLVAGLAWNDAIKSLIERFFPASSGSDLALKFIYAGLITLTVVTVSVYLARLDKKKEEQRS